MRFGFGRTHWFGQTKRFGQPNQNRTKTLHKSYFILTNEEIHPKFLYFIRILHMRKYLLHQFMTAFVAFPFNFILEKPTKKIFAFVKVQILLLTNSVRVRFGFGEFSSGSGSVRPNQKNMVRSTTTRYTHDT